MSTVNREVFWNAVQLRDDAAERVAARADLATWERLDEQHDARSAARLDRQLDEAFGPLQPFGGVQ